MTAVPKIIRLPELTRKHIPGRPIAAPFDVPSAIAVTFLEGRLNCQLLYVGDDEPRRNETLGEVTFGFGIVSKRLLSISVPTTDLKAAFDVAIALLDQRRSELQRVLVPGQPLRQAAHYDVMGEVLPSLPALVETQLRELRQEQTRR